MRRRKAWMMTLGMLALLGAGLALLMPREQSLRDVSHRIASTEYWAGTNSWSGINSEGYAWLSEDELLILRYDKESSQGTNHIRAYRYKIASGTETPLVDFNRSQAANLVSRYFYPFNDSDFNDRNARWALLNARLSPDRKQLLWLSGRPADFTWRICRLDGTPVGVWKAYSPEPDLSYVLWFSDSHHWLQSTTSLPVKVRVFDTAAPRQVVEKALPPSLTYMPLGFLPDGRLVTASPWMPGALPMLNATRWQEAGPVGEALLSQFHSGSEVKEIALAPDGRRLALFCRLTHVLPGPPAVQKALRALGMRDRSVWALCTCRPDGSDLQEIGHLPEHPQPPATSAIVLTPAGVLPPPASPSPAEEAALPHNLQWSPNGKRLSYCQDGALYTVATE